MLSLVFALGTSVSVYAGEMRMYSVDVDGNNSDISNKSNFDVLALFEDEKQNNFSIKAKDIGERNAELVWSGDNVFLSYEVCMLNPLTKTYDDYDTVTQNEIKLSSLRPDTIYHFCVKNPETEEILGAVRFRTKSLKPQLKVKNVSYNQVELSVSNVSDGVTVEIYRGKTEAIMKKIGSVKGEASFTDKKVKETETYYYKAKAVSKKSKSVTKHKNSDIVSVAVPKNMGLPKVTGETKTYAYYTAVTAKTTPQYKLLNSKECYTDPETGIRMYDGCYCVALGSYYGSAIGTKYRITLSTGKSINVILCDQKSNRHTDKNHQYAVKNQDIVEFYVEKGSIPNGVRGDYGHLEQFSGKIVSIEKF